MTQDVIGFVYDSDFYEKWGTPRQGPCTSAKSVIKLYEHELPEFLEIGEPVIVLFVFHLNTSASTIIGGQHFARMPSKIKMPKCPTGKQSVFATRTPHRPNPIGLSVAIISWLDRESGLVELEGSDLIVGTPVVALHEYDKSYHGLADARFPLWVTKPLESSPIDVCIPDCLAEQIESRDLTVMIDILKQDVRSRRSRSEHQDGTFCHCVCGAKIFVVYRYRTNGLCVIDLAKVDQIDQCEKLFESADLANRVRTGVTSGRAPEVLDVIRRKPGLCSHLI